MVVEGDSTILTDIVGDNGILIVIDGEFIGYYDRI